MKQSPNAREKSCTLLDNFNKIIFSARFLEISACIIFQNTQILFLSCNVLRESLLCIIKLFIIDERANL